jgi:hypothetical protein
MWPQHIEDGLLLQKLMWPPLLLSVIYFEDFLLRNTIVNHMFEAGSSIYIK